MAFTSQLAITDVSFHKGVLFMQVSERVYGSKERLLILFHPIYWPMFARQYCLTFQSKQLLRKFIDSKHNHDHKRCNLLRCQQMRRDAVSPLCLPIPIFSALCRQALRLSLRTLPLIPVFSPFPSSSFLSTRTSRMPHVIPPPCSRTHKQWNGRSHSSSTPPNPGPTTTHLHANRSASHPFRGRIYKDSPFHLLEHHETTTPTSSRDHSLSTSRSNSTASLARHDSYRRRTSSTRPPLLSRAMQTPNPPPPILHPPSGPSAPLPLLRPRQIILAILLARRP
jgi:hypothetical protein